MKKAVIILIFAFSSLLCMTSAAKEKDEIIPPKAYILVESKTATVLEENNSHERFNSGYMSKLMSLLIIAEDIGDKKYSLTDELTASETVKSLKGSVVWLEPGDKMSVDELLKGVIIGNANDALCVLAEKSCGDIESFTKRMNEKASELKLADTAYFSPYGYYDVREYTSAYDIALVCSKLYKYDFLTGYFKTWRDFIREGSVELVNENTLSRTYKRHGGFKAAHSDETGFCIAECGIDETGTSFIAVVLGADNEDVSFGLSKDLIGKGFSGFKVTDSFISDDLLKPVIVRNGESQYVGLSIEGENDIVVPNGTDRLRFVSVVPKYLSAPVKKGDRVGVTGVYNGKELICEAAILVENDINKLTYSYVFKKMLSNIIE